MADDESESVESGPVEFFEQASSAASEQHEPSETTEGACKKVFNSDLSFERCFMCGLEHESPEFGPYCAVCHDFLYPNALLVSERETESMHFATCGETTSSESATYESKESSVCSGPVPESEDSGCESENEISSESNDPAAFEPTSMSRYKLPYLSLYERIRAPNNIAKRLANELNFVEEDLFETLPPESEFIVTRSYRPVMVCFFFIYSHSYANNGNEQVIACCSLCALPVLGCKKFSIFTCTPSSPSLEIVGFCKGTLDFFFKEIDKIWILQIFFSTTCRDEKN